MKTVLCGHTGSVNRGCEAIIRSTAGILERYGIKSVLATFAKSQDVDAGICEFSEIVEYRKIKPLSFVYFVLGFLSRVLRIKGAVHHYVQGDVWKNLNGNIAINIGGDTYCYGKPTVSYYLNRYTHKEGITSILWGCSIEKDCIDQEMIDDLNRYALIMPRETISYDNLLSAGISKEKIRLMSDPAFTLKMQDVTLPKIFEEGKMIGLNLSPLVINCGPDGRIAMNNYLKLVDYILNQTDFKIALIPHVYTENTEDMLPLKDIYNRYKSTDRLVLFSEKYNCMQLKYIISKCRMVVVARTHASIAAYSTCVPTLVVGYSVKAKGIARDIFGTYENYVLPVQSLKSADELTNAFKWLMQNEEGIRHHLQSFMPGYIEKAWQAGEEVKMLIEDVA